MVFAWYFQDGWEGSGVGIDAMAYTVGDLVEKEESGTCYSFMGYRDATCMLIDQDNANVLALNELVERGFDGGIVGLAVHHQEVLLRVWGCRDMLSECQVLIHT